MKKDELLNDKEFLRPHRGLAQRGDVRLAHVEDLVEVVLVGN